LTPEIALGLVQGFEPWAEKVQHASLRTGEFLLLGKNHAQMPGRIRRLPGGGAKGLFLRDLIGRDGKLRSTKPD
jgi:hypothetical protein